MSVIDEKLRIILDSTRARENTFKRGPAPGLDFERTAGATLDRPCALGTRGLWDLC